MRKFIYVIIMVFSLQSCSSVLFTSAQPEDTPALREFPERLLGTFANREDTLVVERTSFVYDGGDAVNLTGDIKPPGAVLKKMNDWYFLSFKDEEDWWIYPFQISGEDRITVYFSDMNKKEEKILAEYKGELKFQKIFKEGKLDHYLISPTKEQFQELLKKGLFSKKMTFERIK